jgi:hypothetical protein
MNRQVFCFLLSLSAAVYSAVEHLGSHLIPASLQDKFLLLGELTLPESSWLSWKLDVFLDSSANCFALIDKSFGQLLIIPLE